MKDAISQIEDGCELFLGGFGYNQPYAAVHELIRQEYSDLRIIRASGDTLLDQLIGAGCVREVVSSHCWNAIGPTPTYSFRRAIEQEIPREVAFEEHGLGNFVLRLFAGARTLPFIPAGPVKRTGQFENRVHNDKFRSVTVYSEKHQVMPPLNPDVGIIHVQRADQEGNVQLDGASAEMKWGAMACESLIAITEEIIDTKTIKQAPDTTIVPAFMVDSVVKSPGGSHPSGVMGKYGRDAEYYEYYGDMSSTVDGFENYLETWVFGVTDRTEYLSRLSQEGFKEVLL